MKIVQKFLNNTLRNFNYFVMSEETCECIFFDPCDLSYTLPAARKLGGEPRYLLNTHHHFDHISQNKDFLMLEGTTELNLSYGEVFNLSISESVRCIHTPGHTSDHVSYELIDGGRVIGLICGDTIFNAGVGNCKDKTGDVDTLYETIKGICESYADDVYLYPSHDYFVTNLRFAKNLGPNDKYIDKLIRKVEALGSDEFVISTIGEEKTYNPFFRVFDEAFLKELGESSSREAFVRIRLERDKW